jgi:SAM-dependent methyltransferase
MRKRDLLRCFPGLSKLVTEHDRLLAEHHKVAAESQRLAADRHRLTTENQGLAVENKQLRGVLSQLLFASEGSLGETETTSSNAADGLPVPAAALRFLVAGTEHLEWFLRSGRLGSEALVDILAKQGKTLNEFKTVLDFGCGCGRVLRHLSGLPGTALHGTDPNRWAIQWCEKHLPFAQFKVCSLEPPLPYPDDLFDLIYAFSIFTHLTEPLQARWMDELRRVLAPGGHLILTVHGDKCADALPAAERGDYQQGKLVVVEQEVVGTNFCGAFHPEAYVRSVLTRGFEVADFVPEGAKGNPPQDAYLLRLPQPRQGAAPPRARMLTSVAS